MKNAGRKQMQGKLTVLIDHGMAGISASLKADNNIIFFRQQVDHAALPLISPVDSDDCAVRHRKPPL